jgi:uncharacterized protein YkwD
LDLILVDTRSGKRRTFTLSQRPLLIGRGVDCDIVLPEPGVGEHCGRVTDGGATAHFEVLAREGVTVNGYAALAAEIHPGDVVRIGSFQLVVAVSVNAPPRAAAPAPAPARPSAPPPSDEPRPTPLRATSTRRVHEKRSILVPATVVLVALAAGGFWFWKLQLDRQSATHEPAPITPTEPAPPPAAIDTAPTSASETPATAESSAATPVTAPAADPVPVPVPVAARAPTSAAPPKDDATPPAVADASKPTPSEELWRTLERVGRLLDAEEYSRCRWLLSQQRPGTPKERANVDALRQKVDAAALKAGDDYLKFVEQLVAKGWLLPALNHLQDQSIERFRGLPIWYALTDRADLLEDEVDKVCPAERRPVARVKHGRPHPLDMAAMAPPPIGVTDAEREMDGVAAANHAAPSTATGPSTPARVADPITEARHALEALRFDESAAILEAMPRSQLTAAREMGRQRMSVWAAAAKRVGGAAPGAKPGAPTGGTPGTLIQGLDAKVAAQTLAATRAKQHTTREWLDVAWFALALRDDAAFDDAIAKAAADPEPLVSFKEEVDSALAFRRGLDSVPNGGFAFVDGRWLTAAERDSVAARGALDAAWSALVNAKEATLREATARLIEATKASPATAAGLLRGRAGELGARLAASAERGGLDVVRARVQALADARNAALAFVGDDLTYPTTTPADPAGVKKLADANRELDKRIAAVRQIWGNEQGGAPEPIVELSDDYAALIRQAHALEAALAAIHAPAPDAPEFTAARLLPAFTAKVTVRNYAATLDERRRIDADREVKAQNQVVKETKNSAELELLNLVNAYREMLGVQQLAFDARLYSDAHAYSDVMALQARKEKDDAPQPEPKQAVEKPKLIAGELYLRGKFSARQALQAWLKMPAAHRDLLFARHRAMGAANVGNFWTCTFGVNEPESR